MKTILIAFALFFIYSDSSSQGWEIVYGSNGDLAYYRSIILTSSQTGYLMGNNFYKKTTDGGSSWHKKDSIGNTKYHFLNSETGWVYGTGGLFFTSTGGNNWSNVSSPPAASSLFFINSNTGFSCGINGVINRSTNGGLSWVPLNSGTTNNLNAIYFSSASNGYCAGDWGTILTTTDGGNSWLMFSDIHLGFYSSIEFINVQTGFICGTGGIVYKTTNSGLNWEAVFTGSGQNFKTIKFSNSGTGYIFSTFGEILRTIDGGLTWNTFTNTAFMGNIHSATISPDSKIWVTVDTGIVYSSSDLGYNWDEILRQFITIESLNSVFFINNLTGYTCGDRGVLLRSTNSGLNWVHLNLNTTLHLKDIMFTNETTGYLCGGNGNASGIIFKTVNAGLNWQVTYQDSAQMNALSFINAETGWATGAIGIVLRTTNGGTNWIKHRHQFNSANRDICFIDENTGFLAKNGVGKSTNGGVNWILSTNFSSSFLQFLGQTGFISFSSASNQVLGKTINGGSNWDTYLVGTGSAGPLYFKNIETGWISSSGIMRKTTNGGINWVQQTTSNTSIYVNSIYFTDVNSGWAVGSYGGIMRTVNGGIGITQISSQIPGDFRLFQNFPNPFNPVTKIRFSIPLQAGRDHTLLKIYDALGREIEILVNENLNPGTYEIQWNASKYSSGVYFYSLTTGSSTIARKMVVIK